MGISTYKKRYYVNFLTGIITKEVDTLDKYEYKVRTDEMKQLVREAKFAEAMEIADSIDWRRVKNTKMLLK